MGNQALRTCNLKQATEHKHFGDYCARPGNSYH